MTSAAECVKWGIGRALVVFIALYPVVWLLSFVVTGQLSPANRLNLSVAACVLEYGTLLVMKRFGLKQFMTPPKLYDSINDESKLLAILGWLNSHRRAKWLLSPLQFLGAVAPAGATLVVLAYRYPFAIRLIQTLGMPYTMVSALSIIFALQFLTFNATHPRNASLSQIEKLLAVQNREWSASSLERSSNKLSLNLTGPLSWVVTGVLLSALGLMEIVVYNVFPPATERFLVALALGLVSGTVMVRGTSGHEQRELERILEADHSGAAKTQHLVDVNWPISYTNPLRYSYWGITEFSLEYAEKTGKSSIVVLDVGCATGEATADLKSKLVARGLSVRVIGIDVNSNVAEAAKTNLDEFILGDVMEMDIGSKVQADIVICSFAAIYVEAGRRSLILRRCASALKTDGRLITNADTFQKSELRDEVRALTFLLGSVSEIGHGFREFVSEYKSRSYQLRKRRIYILDGQERAARYPEEIIEGWNRLDLLSKCSWLFSVFLANAQPRVIRQLRNLPRRRRS